ncbi:MAG: hypothetical protein LUE25_05275 [Clostridiales bacterium]|nr:hypothetical protein [Clostridiales bacterium]
MRANVKYFAVIPVLCVLSAIVFAVYSCSGNPAGDDTTQTVGDSETETKISEIIEESSRETAEETTENADAADDISDTETDETPAETSAESSSEADKAADSDETSSTSGGTSSSGASISVTVTVKLGDKYAEYLIYTVNAEMQAALDAANETGDDETFESGEDGSTETEGNDSESETEGETIELYDISESERVILDSVTVTIGIDGGAVTVLDAVTKALSEYGVEYTLDLTGMSISTVAGYAGGTLYCGEETEIFFWGYTVNGEEPTSGRAGTNYVWDGDVITYVIVGLDDSIE